MIRESVAEHKHEYPEVLKISLPNLPECLKIPFEVFSVVFAFERGHKDEEENSPESDEGQVYQLESRYITLEFGHFIDEGSDPGHKAEKAELTEIHDCFEIVVVNNIEQISDRLPEDVIEEVISYTHH